MQGLENEDTSSVFHLIKKTKLPLSMSGVPIIVRSSKGEGAGRGL